MIISRKFISPRGGWFTTLRYLVVAAFASLLITYTFRSRQRPHRKAFPEFKSHPQKEQSELPPYISKPETEVHAIDHLIRQSQKAQKDLLAKESHSLGDAAKRYRQVRGRHPPPGFDKWYEYAKENDAVIVEEFFDRVYHDLRPFWALPASQTRINANTYIQVVRVRNGKAIYVTDNPNRVPWIQLWHSLIAEAAPYLPDVDMPINYMDETRVLVPWDTITEFINLEESKRSMPPARDVISTYPGLRELDKISAPPYDPNWVLNDAVRYWDHARQSCSIDSASRNISAVQDFSAPIAFPAGWPSYSYHGYVANWTEAQDLCTQPHLRGMHGTFTESTSMVTTHELIPVFGGSKLATNNDILIPAAMYLSEQERDAESEATLVEWSQKKDKLFWRGVASGGRNKASNWHHFHRHRWVQAMNGTAISKAERTMRAGETFALPYPGTYDIKSQRDGGLGEWMDTFTDIAFTSLECFPVEFNSKKQRSPKCSYTDPYYTVVEPEPLREQFTNKYLPDVDGNSFSGNWRNLMLSTSLPMKATVYKEWHDDRLMPWVHFVPFDNTFQDVYGIMDYFLRGRDMAAHRIAVEGKEWSEKVLRREDMLLYIWRILLEFARICDDNRDRLGFVDDIL